MFPYRPHVLRRRWPRVGNYPKVLQSVLGLSLDELYLMNQASGNVVGAIAGTTLTVGGSPTFRRQGGGRFGINYNAAGQKHGADVHAFGTDSIYLAAVIEKTVTIGNKNFIGRSNASMVTGLMLFSSSSDIGTIKIADNASHTLSINSGTTALSTGLWLVQALVNRANTTLYGRWSQAGTTPASSQGSISTVGTLDAASQEFGFGNTIAMQAGVAVYWAAIARGTQVENANLPQIVAKKLRFET